MPDYNIPVKSIDKNYSLVLADNYCMLKTNGTNDIIITIPLNASVNFPKGSWFIAVQLETAKITVVAVKGVTIIGTKTATARKGDKLTFIQTSPNTWIV